MTPNITKWEKNRKTCTELKNSIRDEVHHLKMSKTIGSLQRVAVLEVQQDEGERH